MLQTIIQLVHAHSLPVFMIIGLAGCVCCFAADHVRNRELKKLIEETPVQPDTAPENTAPEGSPSRDMEVIDLDSAGSPGVKAHGRSKTYDSVPGTKDPKPPVTALSSAIRRKVLFLNVLGYGFMMAAMAGLYHYGYFDRFLGR